MNARGGAGDAPEGDLPEREREGVGIYFEAARSKTSSEEFWSEGLTVELEGADVAEMANGGGRHSGLQEEDAWKRRGMMRGGPMERPHMVDPGGEYDGQGDQRALRPGGER